MERVPEEFFIVAVEPYLAKAVFHQMFLVREDAEEQAAELKRTIPTAKWKVYRYHGQFQSDVEEH